MGTSEPLATPSLPGRMRDDLTAAMRARDRRTVAVLRTMLAAFANAEAPPRTEPAPTPVVGRLVEHQRLVLTGADLAALVRAEIADRRDTALIYRRVGRSPEADDLDAEVTILERYLPVEPPQAESEVGQAPRGDGPAEQGVGAGDRPRRELVDSPRTVQGHQTDTPEIRGPQVADPDLELG